MVKQFLALANSIHEEKYRLVFLVNNICILKKCVVRDTILFNCTVMLPLLKTWNDSTLIFSCIKCTKLRSKIN